MPITTPAQLFRRAQHRLEQTVKTSSAGGEVLQPSAFWMRATTWALMGTAVFGLAWLALAQTEEIVVAPGKLEPTGGVRDIQIPVNGVIKNLNVKEGQEVKKGQVLLTLDPEATAEREKSLRTSLRLTEDQLRYKEEELERFLDYSSSEQRMLEKNLDLSIQILRRYERLESQGASAELQVLDQRNKVAQTRGQLEQSRADRLRQTAVFDQAMQQLRSQIAQLRGDLTEQTVKVRYQQVVAPLDGVVFDLKPKGPGFVSTDGAPALKIVPFDQLQARVEVASADIGFVHTGQAADLSIDSFPASDFGVLQGTVKRIGSDALPPDQLHQTYRYSTFIGLSSQQLKLKNGKTLPLQVGMSLQANIKLRKVSYMQLLLGGFQDKANSLRRI